MKTQAVVMFLSRVVLRCAVRVDSKEKAPVCMLRRGTETASPPFRAVQLDRSAVVGTSVALVASRTEAFSPYRCGLLRLAPMECSRSPTAPTSRDSRCEGWGGEVGTVFRLLS